MTPTRYKIIEHFKDAKEIQCAHDSKSFGTLDADNLELDIDDQECWLQNPYKDNWLVLWSEQRGYANITKYKSKKDNISLKSDFKDITDNLSSLLDYKNKKYGNAALEPLNIFSGKSKVGHKVDDKLSRIKNNSELLKNDVADTIGYLILICKENGWTNFDEFKD